MMVESFEEFLNRVAPCGDHIPIGEFGDWMLEYWLDFEFSDYRHDVAQDLIHGFFSDVKSLPMALALTCLGKEVCEERLKKAFKKHYKKHPKTEVKVAKK